MSGVKRSFRKGDGYRLRDIKDQVEGIPTDAVWYMTTTPTRNRHMYSPHLELYYYALVATIEIDGDKKTMGFFEEASTAAKAIEALDDMWVLV